ncbi:hypothetical protein [Vibrio parahaemolyticus]|uniref:hypothetical protein n=1 Tax=Vibrio parahaemolyticus TaxID=670 RepID=UPI00041A8D49|nr:hypothetical protein [Vibrio parahaemolyticus]EJG1206612.1 hypothetical protein [Vibrio parahaemolyticus]
MSLLNYEDLYSGKDCTLDGGESINQFKAWKWSFQEYNLDHSDVSKYDVYWKPEYEDIPIYRDLKVRAAFLLYGSNDKLFTSKLRKKNVTIAAIDYCQLLVKDIIDNWEVVPDTLAALAHPIFFEKVKEFLRSKKYSQSSCESVLTSYTTLSDANDFLPLNLQLVFPIQSRNALAKELAVGSKGNHPTIIPELYGQTLGKLIELTGWYHQQLSGDDRPQLGEMDSPLDLVEFRRVAIGLGYTTCMAFSGMRLSEAVFLHKDSYETVDFEGVVTSLLNSSTVKLEQGAIREDVWVCAEICAKAIEVIGLANGGDWKHLPTNHNKLGIMNLTKSNLSSCLTQFKVQHLQPEYKREWDSSYNLLNSNVNNDPRKLREDGTYYWHFTNHTWRRSFAHFAVGNDLSCLGALKQQLKHIFIGMSMIYTSTSDVLALMQVKTDPKLMKELDASRKIYNEKYLSSVVSGEASGGFAENLMVEGEPRVFTDQEFATLEKNNHTASRSTGFGRCFGEEKCSVSHVFQPSSCVSNGCENLSITSEEALRWKVLHDGCVKLISKMLANSTINKNTLGRELSDLRAAEHVMRKHNIEFTEFVFTSV